MTRKTFFKTILGAVGGISVLNCFTKKPVYKCIKLSERELEIAAQGPDWLKCYRKGVKIAQDEAKEGDFSQKSLVKQKKVEANSFGEYWLSEEYLEA